jgi:hypothetical protein
MCKTTIEKGTVPTLRVQGVARPEMNFSPKKLGLSTAGLFGFFPPASGGFNRK